jgi:chloramphenicol O-acetyltransferase
LRYRIKNDTIVCYDEVDVTVTHLDADKNVLFVHPKFHKDAHQFSEQYEKLKLTA